MTMVQSDFTSDEEWARQQELAEALCLLRLSLDLLDEKRAASELAAELLGEALNQATEARIELLRAVDIVEQATRMYALVKGTSV